MSVSMYRKLLANLPSMASVVNSFESNDVQREVYRLLIEEFMQVTDRNETASTVASPAASGEPRGAAKAGGGAVEVAGGPAPQFVDGDSVSPGPGGDRE